MHKAQNRRRSMLIQKAFLYELMPDGAFSQAFIRFAGAKRFQPPVLMPSKKFRCLNGGSLLFVSLTHTRRFKPSSNRNVHYHTVTGSAEYGSLESAPVGRFRWTNHHLRYSTASYDAFMAHGIPFLSAIAATVGRGREGCQRRVGA